MIRFIIVVSLLLSGAVLFAFWYPPGAEPGRSELEGYEYADASVSIEVSADAGADTVQLRHAGGSPLVDHDAILVYVDGRERRFNTSTQLRVGGSVSVPLELEPGDEVRVLVLDVDRREIIVDTTARA